MLETVAQGRYDNGPALLVLVEELLDMLDMPIVDAGNNDVVDMGIDVGELVADIMVGTRMDTVI